jgi:hypothetical protein
MAEGRWRRATGILSCGSGSSSYSTSSTHFNSIQLI